jgi:hypothetical protein
MRILIVGLALLAAACSVETGRGGSHGGGYTVDIRAVENSAIYVVTAPDGRVASARSQNGTSAILDPQALQQAIAALPAPATNPRYDDHQVSIQAPGFSLRASGDDDGKDGDAAADTDHAPATTTTPASGEKPVAGSTDNDVHGRGHVSMNIGGFSLDAEGDGDEGNGRAHVHLAGLSARDARHFITEADELSPQVQSQMLTALGLSQDE